MARPELDVDLYAQLEMHSLRRAMAARVRTIEVGEPRLLVNNVRYGYRGFRAVFRP